MITNSFWRIKYQYDESNCFNRYIQKKTLRYRVQNACTRKVYIFENV